MLNNHVEWKRLWGKWNELPPPTEKASLHPKVMLCMWWNWKGVLYHELFTVVVQLPSHVWLLWSHGLQYAKLPCPSPSPRVCPSSCPLHQYCHPTISSPDALFSFCPQSFPAWGTFAMSWLFASGIRVFQSIGCQYIWICFLFPPWTVTNDEMLIW